MPSRYAFRRSPDRARPQRALMAVLTVVFAASGAGAAHTALSATSPGCVPKGARLVAADGSVRIIRIAEKRRAGEVRRERFQACWKPTGRRFTLVVERDLVDDRALTRSQFTIRGRTVGRLTRAIADAGKEATTAATYDVLTRRRLHDSKTCNSVRRGSRTGPDEVVFAAEGGGMAFTCDRLLFADRNGEHELEPAGTDVRALALSSPGIANPRLYWVVRDADGTEHVRSRQLSAASVMEPGAAAR